MPLDRKRQLEIEITDSQSPEIRALINEYGFFAIMSGIAMTNGQDVDRLRNFAEANRRKTQEQLEEMCKHVDLQKFANGFRTRRL